MAELFKLMFIDESIIRIVYGHLTYQHIPKEWVGYKFIFKEALDQFSRKNVVPSLGAIAQKYAANPDVIDVVEEIKEAKLVDRDLIIDQLESFIKETEFELLSKKVHDLYEDGKKEDAIRLNAEESKRINDLSLRSTGNNFVNVFSGFESRIKQRQEEQKSAESGPKQKVLFGIDKLDEITHGGADLADIILWIARSGVGKSTALKWHGYCAAIQGYNVLHIQLEGGVDAAVTKYEQMWTNQEYVNLKRGSISKEDWTKIKRAIQQAQDFSREIAVYGFKKFGESSVSDVRNLCIEYQKIYGKFPDLLIVDSLDLLKTGVNKKLDYDPEFKKEKLQKNAQLLKDLAVELNCVIVTATQTSDVPFEVWNNEDKVIDRSYTEGDKTLVKPFSFVFTVNMTIEEKAHDRCRIYIDKNRDYKESSYTFPIVTDYKFGRFYSKKLTLELYKQLADQAQSIEKTPEKETSKRSNKSKAKTI